MSSWSSVSGFSASTYGALPAVMPRFVARAKPAFSVLSISETNGNRSRTISTVPSRESLSTTQTLVLAGA